MAATLAFQAPPGIAHQEDAYRILVLTDSDQRARLFKTIAEAFSSELLQREPRPIVMRYVDLNARDQSAITNEALNRLVIERIFAPEPPDLVLLFYRISALPD